MSIDAPHQASHTDFSSISAAADLIRSIDSAFAEISSNAVSAAREVEDARKNARVASEIARLFSVRPTFSPNVEAHSLIDRFPVFGSLEESDDAAPTKSLSTPPPPPASFDGQPTNLFEKNSSMNESPTMLSYNLVEEVSCSNRRRQFDLSASDRLVKAHAQDVLSVELELERVKQSLEKEQMSHDETKSHLIQAKAKNVQVEAQIEKILSDMETQRENDARALDQLKEQLFRAQFRVSAAEEDAQIALDLAKENSESRVQLESWLQRALEEVQSLREQMLIMSSDSGSHSIAGQNGEHDVVNKTHSISPGRVSDLRTDPDGSSPNYGTGTPSRLMVATGEDLLKRSIHQIDNYEFGQKTVDESIESATEVSRRLRDRLKMIGTEEEFATQSTVPPNQPKEQHSIRNPRSDLGSAVEALDVCYNTAEILKKSGKKLNLTGRWWTGQTDTKLDEIYLETLASHFCTAVEVELDRKHKEILELEALCSIWERESS